MNNDRAEVDELILEIADYENDLADMAAEKFLRKCSTSWEAFRHLQKRVPDGDKRREQVHPQHLSSDS